MYPSIAKAKAMAAPPENGSIYVPPFRSFWSMIDLIKFTKRLLPPGYLNGL